MTQALETTQPQRDHCPQCDRPTARHCAVDQCSWTVCAPCDQVRDPAGNTYRKSAVTRRG